MKHNGCLQWFTGTAPAVENATTPLFCIPSSGTEVLRPRHTVEIASPDDAALRQLLHALLYLLRPCSRALTLIPLTPCGIALSHTVKRHRGPCDCGIPLKLLSPDDAALSHPCDRGIPFILNIKKALWLTSARAPKQTK